MDRLSQLKAFLAEQPADPFLNYALAQEHISMGDDAGAREIFDRLLSGDPGYVATYYHYGKLLERASDKEAAMEMYRRGIAAAREAKEQHSLSELQSALLELEYE